MGDLDLDLITGLAARLRAAKAARPRSGMPLDRNGQRPILADPEFFDRITARWAAEFQEFEAAYAAEHDAEPEPEPELKIVKRKRRPDPIAMVKRAQEAGLTVRSVNIIDNGNSVLLTLGDQVPSPADPAVIETPDDLRRLI